MRIRIFTDRPGQGETGHAHLSNTRQLPSMGRSVIPRYSAAQKKKVRKIFQNHHFPVFMNKTQIFLFALGATTPVARVRSRSTRPRQRSSNRSWTGPWSAPCILQLQGAGASVVALRFLLRFPAFSQKEQNGPFFAFSWRFQKPLTALAPSS